MTTTLADARSNPRFGSWAGIWPAHRAFILIALVNTAALFVVDLTELAPATFWPGWQFWDGLLLLELPLYIFAGVAIWQRLFRRKSWRSIWSALDVGPRFVRCAIVLIFAHTILLDGGAWKTAIPILNPYRFDRALHELDAALIGTTPWQHLGWFLSPDALRFLDQFYVEWFIVFALVLLWVGWLPDSPWRRRFLTSLALTWPIGALASIIWSSVGPCFYGAVVAGPDPYAGLMAYQHRLGLAAEHIRGMLWGAYTHTGPKLVGGIAAFPSLHVAMPALYLWSARSPVWRGVWALMLILTWIGSILLGWHYMVDGLAAIAGTGIIWWLTGRVHQPAESTATGY